MRIQKITTRPILAQQYNVPSSNFEKLNTTTICDWIRCILQTVGEIKLAPTIASRFYFLTCCIIHDVFTSFHTDLELVDMFKTIGKFETFDYTVNKDVWIELAIHDGLTLLYQHLGYSQRFLIETIELHTSLYPNIYNYKSETLFQDWKYRVSVYLQLRSQDGSAVASVFTPSTEYPNPNQYIYAASSQDLTQLTDVDKWCALDVSNKKQKYLTPQWGDVKGILSSSQVQALATQIGSTFFPSNETHQQEVLELYQLVQSLDEKEKMIAEFWAGGPSTCTPPGFWMFFSVYSVMCNGLDFKDQVLLFYRMSAGLFQASICAWKVKRMYLQERPIQAIRKLRPIRTMTMYNGSTGDNTIWLPYQESNFVTPPFPDFVSGHSTFSSIGSRILTDFFKTNIIPTNIQIRKEDILILSPILRDMDTTCNLCEITIYPSMSNIESTNPTTGITLGWTTWDEMASQAGKSRLYGGIHYESSNQGGLALGRYIQRML